MNNKPLYQLILDGEDTPLDHALSTARKSSRLDFISSIKHDGGEDCGCPLCNVDCQDDYEYFTGTGQYAEEEK